MKPARGLFARVVAPANLHAAWIDARRGKRSRPDVQAFEANADARLATLADALAAGEWRPAGHRVFIIRRPKPRLIAAAPFADRVVHHAIHRVIEPVLSRRFIDHTYACLPDRGAHRAVLRFADGLRRFRWVARLDVRRYFLEIDWDRLLAIIARAVHDPPLLALVDRVLVGGGGLYTGAVLDALGIAGAYRPAPRKGLPIGNLTSQLFANLYLDGLDHFAQRELKVPRYLRYMDDAVIFGDARARVTEQVEACREWLASERGLELHADRARPRATRQGHCFLGYTVWPGRWQVSGRTLRRAAARVKAAARGGSLGPAPLETELAARIGALLL